MLGDIAGGAQSFAEINVGKVCAPRRVWRRPTGRSYASTRRAGGATSTACGSWPTGGSVVLEVDGSFHAEVRAWWKDMKRERAVVVQGDTVLRCSSMELRLEANDVIADLRRSECRPETDSSHAS